MSETWPYCWVGKVLAARGADIPAGLLKCDGPMDRHHLVKKQHIKREWNAICTRLAAAEGDAIAQYGISPRWAENGPLNLRDVLADPRDLVDTCRRHHDLLERALVKLKRVELPGCVEEFAAELGVEHVLCRYYGPRAVPA